MDTLFIFGAEKLFLLSPLVAAYFFYKLDKVKQKEVLIFAFFSLPLTFILGMILREFYFNPRPFVVNGFEPLIHHAPDNGFPSDHVLLLAAIASIVIFFSKKYAIALWIIVGLIGISRMYAGVHHSIDILGSILIALLSTSVVYAVSCWKKMI
ncbi:MAG: phosphatase PAP2 family protein [Candidatus Zambryskibacteria bacterium]|nr:phosphatase PAP2 family protein [Candidatus Zambryskibacteria bacterium]